jgi:hypothetical protein
MTKPRITDKDRGAKALLDRLGGGSRLLAVGVLEGDATHPNSDLTINEIAEIHEYGSDAAGIPERSFIRAFVDENEARINKALKRIADMTAKGSLKSVDQGLDRLGLTLVGGIQDRIRNGIAPELQDATAARKGSSVPLIDTSALLTSITHEVEET